MNVLLLGYGMIGRTIAFDLVQDEMITLTAADISKTALNKSKHSSIRTVQIDCTAESKLNNLIQNYDLVINAVPGFIGFNTLTQIIESGKDVVDIAFYADDPFTLNELAIRKNVTAIVDCGVTPGLSNFLIGNSLSKFDRIENIEIYVGGLPKKKDGLLDYKAVFSVSDLIEEYLRPARSIKNGKTVITAALSEIKSVIFKDHVVFEAFNSDGLRTLLKTIPALNMNEYTVRYPGHTDKMKLFRDLGFFSKDEVDINGETIIPLEFTASLLYKILRLTENDKDVTLLKIIMEGERGNEKKKITYEMIDEFDETTNTHSMARTTGYMATMCVRLIVANLFNKKGIFPPELLGKNENVFSFVIKGLEERKIYIRSE